MHHLTRRLGLIIAAVALVFGALAGEASASTSRSLQSVTISNTGSGDVDVLSGPFTTTGPLCPTGTAETTSRTVLSSGDGYLNLYVTKHLTCDDGSGTFDLGLVVHLTFAPFKDNFVWAVIGGTGSYEHLRGAGTGTGSLQEDGSLIDTYSGLVVGAS